MIVTHIHELTCVVIMYLVISTGMKVVLSQGHLPARWSEQDDYVQPKMLWQNMSEEDQEQTTKNIAGHIQGAKDFIIQRQLGIFRKCDSSLADKVEEMLDMKKKSQDPYTMVA